MLFFITSLVTALVASTSAAPTRVQPVAALANFLLVTTNQCESAHKSSALANVSATSLFDPFDQSTYLLRLIGPGYNSLPTFNLTNGDLNTQAEEPEAIGEAVYNSTGAVTAGAELGFTPSTEPAGNLGLKDGYLLTVGGQEKGWTICDGPLEQSVIYWKGNASGCTPTYIHAVTDAPY